MKISCTIILLLVMLEKYITEWLYYQDNQRAGEQKETFQQPFTKSVVLS